MNRDGSSRFGRERSPPARLRELRSLSKLEYLNLYGTAVTDAALVPLRQLPALRRLYVSFTGVTPAAAAAFAQARVDPAQVAELQRQIADLQARIQQQHISVVGATFAPPPTTPTTRATTTRSITAAR